MSAGKRKNIAVFPNSYADTCYAIAKSRAFNRFDYIKNVIWLQSLLYLCSYTLAVWQVKAKAK